MCARSVALHPRSRLLGAFGGTTICFTLCFCRGCAHQVRCRVCWLVGRTEMMPSWDIDACVMISDNMLLLLCSDYLFKLLLIGDSSVGKSCLLLRFAVSFPSFLQITDWVRRTRLLLLLTKAASFDFDPCIHRMIRSLTPTSVPSALISSVHPLSLSLLYTALRLYSLFLDHQLTAIMPCFSENPHCRPWWKDCQATDCKLIHSHPFIYFCHRQLDSFMSCGIRNMWFYTSY